VARDRQRAKQRRQRQAGSVRARARQAGDAAPSDRRDLQDPPRSGSTPTPDPLKHASAEVDEARLAEAGAVHPDADLDDDLLFGEDDDDDRAPDAVEGDASGARVSDRERVQRDRGRLLTFLRHCVEELRRVQWPDRRQVGQATAVVLGFVVLAGGYLGLMDAIFRPLVNAIL
jgi:preprotein translocase subunit SecE